MSTNSVFEEARQVLDQFPIGHAQFIQDRLRAGLIDGRTYYSIEQGVCTTCFYGGILLMEGYHGIHDTINDQGGGGKLYCELARPFHDSQFNTTPLEDWLSDWGNSWNADQWRAIRFNSTPENNQRAAELDAFLSDYILNRLRQAEVTEPSLPIAELA